MIGICVKIFVFVWDNSRNICTFVLNKSITNNENTTIMKNLFLLAVALIMSCTIAFAQSNTPFAKGKYFGKKMIEYALSENEEAIEKLGNEVEKYYDENIDTLEEIESFFNGFEQGIYAGCEEVGLGKDVAAEIVEAFAASILEELVV